MWLGLNLQQMIDVTYMVTAYLGYLIRKKPDRDDTVSSKTD